MLSLVCAMLHLLYESNASFIRSCPINKVYMHTEDLSFWVLYRQLSVPGEQLEFGI